MQGKLSEAMANESSMTMLSHYSQFKERLSEAIANESCMTMLSHFSQCKEKLSETMANESSITMLSHCSQFKERDCQGELDTAEHFWIKRYSIAYPAISESN